MLTEEAHHMFVGETGVGRIVQRTAELMAQHRLDNPDQVRGLGVIDLQTIQRYLNFHYSVTPDLFGGDVSSNAASYYTTGLKGRYDETGIGDDHVLADATYKVGTVSNGSVVEEDIPALNALNERLRDDYIGEVQAGVARWNKIIEATGVPFRLTLPHKGFHRAIGNFAGHHLTPSGEVISQDQWVARRSEWLPSHHDYTFVQAMMQGRVVDPGKFANWIAPPRRGINQQPVDFEYVRFN
jgi:benzoyl-CoA 2,3-dioxygenase component B